MPKHEDRMKEAMEWLDARGQYYEKVTDYQIKIGGDVSYYPGKGTIFVDREICARDERGLGGLEKVLLELKYLAREYATPTLVSATPTRR